VFDNVLGQEQLKRWRTAVDSAVTTRGNDWRMSEKGQEDTTNVDFDFYLNVFTQRVNLWKSDPEMHKLLLECGKIIGKAACELEGVHAMRLWHDQALIKEAWANTTAWHIDIPFWSFDSVHATSMWIALDDATVENGCMYFLPGSQKVVEKKFHESDKKFHEIKIGKNMRDLFEYYPDIKTLHSVVDGMKAGSCSFHSGMLAHGAGANMTPGRRRAMTYQFMPDGSTFNGKQNILTKEQMAQFKIGDPLNDDSINPILWSSK